MDAIDKKIFISFGANARIPLKIAEQVFLSPPAVFRRSPHRADESSSIITGYRVTVAQKSGLSSLHLSMWCCRQAVKEDFMPVSVPAQAWWSATCGGFPCCSKFVFPTPSSWMLCGQCRTLARPQTQIIFSEVMGHREPGLGRKRTDRLPQRMKCEKPGGAARFPRHPFFFFMKKKPVLPAKTSFYDLPWICCKQHLKIVIIFFNKNSKEEAAVRRKQWNILTRFEKEADF